jgi:hypothetical protein
MASHLEIELTSFLNQSLTLGQVTFTHFHYSPNPKPDLDPYPQSPPNRLDVPEHWVTDNGYVHLCVAKGTLVPAKTLRAGHVAQQASRTLARTHEPTQIINPNYWPPLVLALIPPRPDTYSHHRLTASGAFPRSSRVTRPLHSARHNYRAPPSPPTS